MLLLSCSCQYFHIWDEGIKSCQWSSETLVSAKIRVLCSATVWGGGCASWAAVSTVLPHNLQQCLMPFKVHHPESFASAPLWSGSLVFTMLWNYILTLDVSQITGSSLNQSLKLSRDSMYFYAMFSGFVLQWYGTTLVKLPAFCFYGVRTRNNYLPEGKFLLWLLHAVDGRWILVYLLMGVLHCSVR